MKTGKPQYIYRIRKSVIGNGPRSDHDLNCNLVRFTKDVGISMLRCGNSKKVMGVTRKYNPNRRMVSCSKKIFLADKKRIQSLESKMDKVPKGYTKEQWELFQNNPMSFCIKEMNNSNPSVRYNAVDILRGLAFDAVEAIPVLSEILLTDPDSDVRAHIAFTLQELCGCVDVSKRKPALDALIYRKETEEVPGVIDEIEDALNTIKELPRTVSKRIK